MLALREEYRQVLRWAREKGKVVVSQSSFFSGWQVAVEPADPAILRLDVAPYSWRRGVTRYAEMIANYRMRVHLMQDTGIYFELTQKALGTRGRVFEEGEGLIEIPAVDAVFWTETSMLKETVKLLGDPQVQDALLMGRMLRILEVAGDRIDLVFQKNPFFLDRMYKLTQVLIHRTESL